MTAALATPRWRLSYIPALDGLRGVAVLLVMGYHFQVPGFRHGGATGVAMFFALSGFLITSLLLEERTRTGRIDFAAFYRRRARRLLPALAVVLISVLLVAAILDEFDQIALPAAAAAFYVANWAYWFGWAEMGPLTHTWTLAVEEQFYLAWPLIVGAAFAAARWVRWSGVASGLALVIVLQQGGLAILAGSALAVLMHTNRAQRAPVWLAAGALAVILAPSWLAVEMAPGIALIGLLTTPIIACLARSQTTLGRLFALPPLRRIGRISYGLYLWHVPLTWLALHRLGWPLPDVGVAAVLALASFAIALASWRWVEAPALAHGRPVIATGARRGSPAGQPL